MIAFPKEEYSAAVERESTVRDVSFLGVTEDVCGVAVRPMSLRDFIALDGIKSPFICGGFPSATDAVIFLWLLSPSFKPGSFAAWRFARGVRGKDYGELTKAIQEYVSEALMDMPGGGGRGGVSYYSFAVAVVDLLASEYGWSEAEIMNAPMKRTLQYFNAIRKRKNPNSILFNPLSDGVRSKWLRERSAN